MSWSRSGVCSDDVLYAEVSSLGAVAFQEIVEEIVGVIHGKLDARARPRNCRIVLAARVVSYAGDRCNLRASPIT